MKKTYEVRVRRVIEEEYVDIEVEASSPEEAQSLALDEAVTNMSTLFGEMPDPELVADEPLEVEE